MKILIIRPTPNEVNLNTYNLQEVGLAKALIRKGHLCDVMYYCGKEKDHVETRKFDGNRSLNILWLHGIGCLHEGIYLSLKKYINNYDVIQVGGYTGLTSCWLNRKYADKTVNYQGSYFCKYNYGDIKRAAIFDRVLLPLQNKKNMIVVTKSVLATQYVKSKGIKDVTTVGVGLDPDNLLEDNENIYEHEFIKEMQRKKENNKYLLYIGVLEERRNILFLIETVKKVVDRVPEIKLILIGSGRQEYTSKCFRFIKQLGLEENIIYRDRLEQKHMKAVYEISDIFLLPTRYEIFGMVLLEAMFFGLPTITTYNGGSSTLMTKDNGVIIPELDSELWCEKIVDLICSQDQYWRLSTEAHKTIVNHYTWDVLADKFLEVYKKRWKGIAL